MRTSSKFALVSLFFATSCGLLGVSARGAVDHQEAVAVFQEAKAISDRDAGKLWGQTLYGPILLVEPTNSSTVANQTDRGGTLKADGPVFTGILPDSVIIANTPTEWEGARWTQLIWPLPTEVAKRHVLLAHELFHRIQPDLKLTRNEVANQQLDALEGRYLMQLEWRALAQALKASGPVDRRVAIVDALLFRHERYRQFDKAADEENALMINEGVPEYTGVKLGLTTPKEQIDYASYDLSAFVKAPTFVRSFAYALGPAYGLLLDEADPAWRGKLNSGKRLDELLSAALKLPAPDFATLKAREAQYDPDGMLRASEEKRDRDRRAYLASLKAHLVDGPVVRFPLIHSNYQFNPQTLQPLGDEGTVYPTVRLTDDWGSLEVESGGALLNEKAKVATVSTAGIQSSNLSGDGWRLTLNKGWAVQPGPRAHDLVVKKAEGAK